MASEKGLSGFDVFGIFAFLGLGGALVWALFFRNKPAPPPPPPPPPPPAAPYTAPGGGGGFNPLDLVSTIAGFFL